MTDNGEELGGTNISREGLQRPIHDAIINLTGGGRHDRPEIDDGSPPQVREFAKKSVDQAERAVSSFMESASKSIAMVPTPMNDVAKHALAIAEANVRASFDHARKLMQAKDIAEVMLLQTEFLRSQFGVATGQFKQMTGGAASAAEDVTKTST